MINNYLKLLKKQIRRQRGGSSEPRPSPQASPAIKDPPISTNDISPIKDKTLPGETFELVSIEKSKEDNESLLKQTNEPIIVSSSLSYKSIPFIPASERTTTVEKNDNNTEIATKPNETTTQGKTHKPKVLKRSRKGKKTEKTGSTSSATSSTTSSTTKGTSTTSKTVPTITSTIPPTDSMEIQKKKRSKEQPSLSSLESVSTLEKQDVASLLDSTDEKNDLDEKDKSKGRNKRDFSTRIRPPSTCSK